MLVSLSLRNIVLIDRLDLAFEAGLCVLTGETGAGKSILLDALGLALGARADSALVSAGASQAGVTAVFEPPAGHPVHGELSDHDLTSEDGEPLVLRRTLGSDGRSRAFVNDQAVSVALLRRIGDGLVEVQGQFEQRGLLDPTTHRLLLDAFGGLAGQSDAVAALWQAWQAARTEETAAEEALAKARADESHLRHAVDELGSLDPQAGEEAELAEIRSLLLHAERLAEALNAAATLLAGEAEGGAEPAVAQAQRQLERVAELAGGRLGPALAALDRAAAELAEARAEIASLSADLDSDPGRLSEIEERFFALKDAARKHDCTVDELPALCRDLTQRLAALDSGGERLQQLAAASRAAQTAYRKAGEALGEARRAAASRLDAAILRELPPLKLDKARFATRVDRQPESAWGPSGLDRVAFEVATNPGTPAGALAKIASGGELARFLLALKVVLAELSPVETLVFDEVDSGIGGATAAAVGDRLARLAETRQILVVTHSPQVAARATHHWLVRKDSAAAGSFTRVARLDENARREEVARMLSGAHITDEARAAAAKLMGAA
jgi:DNA repair protein RecN (Recombination protein N)